jgi:hypothetical protein
MAALGLAEVTKTVADMHMAIIEVQLLSGCLQYCPITLSLVHWLQGLVKLLLLYSRCRIIRLLRLKTRQSTERMVCLMRLWTKSLQCCKGLRLADRAWWHNSCQLC